MPSFAEIILRLLMALFLGALIGLEREWRYHSAGLRTNTLVCLGCAFFTIISAFGFLNLAHVNHLQVDPTRIASYIIAGIGFLGGGAIYTLEKEEKVKGLTTASGIWIVAAIGMACGVGMLWEAGLTTLLALFVLIALHYFEKRLLPTRDLHTQFIEIELHTTSGALLEHIYDLSKEYHVEVEKVDFHSDAQKDLLGLHCRFSQQAALLQFLDALRILPGVQSLHSSFPIAGRKHAL